MKCLFDRKGISEKKSQDEITLRRRREKLCLVIVDRFVIDGNHVTFHFVNKRNVAGEEWIRSKAGNVYEEDKYRSYFVARRSQR